MDKRKSFQKALIIYVSIDVLDNLQFFELNVRYRYKFMIPVDQWSEFRRLVISPVSFPIPVVNHSDDCACSLIN